MAVSIVYQLELVQICDDNPKVEFLPDCRTELLSSEFFNGKPVRQACEVVCSGSFLKESVLGFDFAAHLSGSATYSNAGQQFPGVKWLVDVIVRSGVQSLDNIFLLGLRGDQDNVRAAILRLTDLTTQFYTPRDRASSNP
jgi:hypothetical protein